MAASNFLFWFFWMTTFVDCEVQQFRKQHDMLINDSKVGAWNNRCKPSDMIDRNCAGQLRQVSTTGHAPLRHTLGSSSQQGCLKIVPTNGRQLAPQPSTFMSLRMFLKTSTWIPLTFDVHTFPRECMECPPMSCVFQSQSFGRCPAVIWQHTTLCAPILQKKELPTFANVLSVNHTDSPADL